MSIVLSIAQIIVALFLIGVILLQAQGSGLSPVFGGGGELFRSKRAIEKSLVIATVVLSALLGVISIMLLLPR
ncbi:MAG TPA: preprotein translocase subunit SecG [Patescibacteria group bacterium]|nr:preprotein translocase subunit SecG [Patescibacteria group bacterium]